jgi:hypothetical protein
MNKDINNYYDDEDINKTYNIAATKRDSLQYLFEFGFITILGKFEQMLIIFYFIPLFFVGLFGIYIF